MYVCMYVRTYARMYVCMYVCMYVSYIIYLKQTPPVAISSHHASSTRPLMWRFRVIIGLKRPLATSVHVARFITDIKHAPSFDDSGA